MRILNDVPLFRSLKGWSVADLGGDLSAGLTLAAIAIPEQMATASLGGFGPAIGFFAFIAGSIAFAVFGSSRYLSVGADSTITPIFAGGLTVLAVAGTPAYAAFAATLGLLVGAILILAGSFRMGWIANLLSVPVTTGFLAGIAIHIAVSQLPALLGIPAGQGNFFAHVADISRNIRHTNLFVMALGVGVFFTTLVSEKISSRIPGALIGVGLATIATIGFHLESSGVAVLGDIVGTFLHLEIPSLGGEELSRLAALALLISLVVMMQTAATSSSFSPAKDEPPDVNHDFIGVGAGSVLSGLFGAFPVNSSPPRTAVAVESGGRSQLAGLIAASIVAALISFGPSLLTHVPRAALAGVLLFVAQRITRFSVMAQIYRQATGEFALIVATMVAIVALPIQIGVAAGIMFSIFQGVWATTRSRVIEFERLPGTSIWWPPEKLAKGEKVDGVMVLAFQAPLTFLNAHTFRRDFLATVRHAPRPLKAIVLEASNIVEIDFTASQILVQVIGHCRDAGVSFEIARLESLRGQDDLKRLGILELLGHEQIFHSVEAAIDELRRTGLIADGSATPA
jgi:MFS superfamily sulfate permease-like transporter